VDENVGEQTQRRNVLFNRLCAVCFGVTVTLVACYIKNLGPLFPLANKIVSCFSGVMIPVFLLGMFSSRARGLGVAVGAVTGVCMMFIWGFGHDLGLFEKPLGYGWTSTVGFVTTVAVCTLVSLIQSLVERVLGVPAPTEKTQWLWKNVMARPRQDEF
jgi:Na+/proline symporter